MRTFTADHDGCVVRKIEHRGTELRVFRKGSMRKPETVPIEGNGMRQIDLLFEEGTWEEKVLLRPDPDAEGEREEFTTVTHMRIPRGRYSEV